MPDRPINVLDAFALSAHLRAGQPAVFPTDTLPALAVLPTAAAALWRLKQRPANKPLILLGADGDSLWALLGMEPLPAWGAMAARGWPGALTLVVPARGPVVEALNPGGSSLGLRIPACPMALQLLRCTGPLATTSVNRSGQPACTSPEEIARNFPSLALLAPLPWPMGSGKASTVVGWHQGENGSCWQILRQGNLRINIAEIGRSEQS
ncbi:MAG: Sua5/YciO/YrdC/YwlC family protein [Synechococcaceae bacterium WB7_1B_046]|nr:Sua5/YciO/YrdC/YwlC family protein [Synechococcaceae bacterium WB7_1B_046]